MFLKNCIIRRSIYGFLVHWIVQTQEFLTPSSSPSSEVLDSNSRTWAISVPWAISGQLTFLFWWSFLAWFSPTIALVVFLRVLLRGEVSKRGPLLDPLAVLLLLFLPPLLFWWSCTDSLLLASSMTTYSLSSAKDPFLVLLLLLLSSPLSLMFLEGT